jgi:hypothetical protein
VAYSLLRGPTALNLTDSRFFRESEQARPRVVFWTSEKKFRCFALIKNEKNAIIAPNKSKKPA